MGKRSAAVDTAIRKTYAALASAAAKRAFEEVTKGQQQSCLTACGYMGWTEEWLDKAGAQATKWRYSTPFA